MSDAALRDGGRAAEAPADESDTSNQVATDIPDDASSEIAEDTLGGSGREPGGEGVATESEAVPEDVPEVASRDTPEDAFFGVPEDVPDDPLHSLGECSSSETHDSIRGDSPGDLPEASSEATSRATHEEQSEESLAERTTGRNGQAHSEHLVSGEIDCFPDSPRAMETLSDFRPESWERLSLDDKKESIEGLADYNVDILGIEHEPSIEYYAADDPGDYGRFSGDQNALALNERNLGDGPETADTVSHELRHAYQYQHAQDPTCERDFQFREDLDNPIAPEQDFAGYKDQIIESDARDYAQRFRERVAG